tara:strand:+ start:19675 stop:20106 length:432 start_codon:yes stop_codon:yes gene_type:complete
MTLEQDITPLNSELMDSLAVSTQMDWINYEPGAAMKILWTGTESGRWAVLFKWDKGYAAGQHKHLSAAYTFILKGRLQVRDSVLNPGDFVYEPNGMIHGKTTALEDTEYFFMCDGPVLFFDDNGFNGYLGWEELERLRESAQA